MREIQEIIEHRNYLLGEYYKTYDELKKHKLDAKIETLNYILGLNREDKI